MRVFEKTTTPKENSQIKEDKFRQNNKPSYMGGAVSKNPQNGIK